MPMDAVSQGTVGEGDERARGGGVEVDRERFADTSHGGPQRWQCRDERRCGGHGSGRGIDRGSGRIRGAGCRGAAPRHSPLNRRR